MTTLLEQAQAGEEAIFLHSKPVHPDIVRQSDSFTGMPIRINTQDDIASNAAMRALRDWKESIGSDQISNTSETYSTVGNATSFFWLEASPANLDWMSYLNELSFIHDNVGDSSDYDFAIRWNESYRNALNMEDSKDKNTVILKNLISKGLLDSIQNNKEIASRLARLIGEYWLSEVSSTEHITDIEEYFAIRFSNLGWRCYILWCDISLGTNLQDSEWQLLAHFTKSCATAMTLTNDYWSWPKEKHQSPSRINNILPVIMRKDRVSESKALEMIKSMILHREDAILKERERLYHDHPSLPQRLRRFIEVLVASVGSVHFWHSVAPRYNSHKTKSEVTNAEQHPHEETSSDPNRGQSEARSPIYEAHINSLMEDPTNKDIRSPSKEFYLDDSVLLAPITYIQSLPSKNTRSNLVDAFNIWFRVPQPQVRVIKEVINDLHNSSLILDDIQDESPLRRGNTATHLIFGPAQSINSAIYMFVQATAKINKLEEAKVTPIFLEELTNLFIGQSWDLEWRLLTHCPTEEEYLAMVDRKTGAMIMMLLRLLQAMSCQKDITTTTSFQSLVHLLARWYQVRDDYMNLQDQEYFKQKGHCEDLDEGKLSLPVIKCCKMDSRMGDVILGIFRMKRSSKSPSSLTTESKAQIIRMLYKSGALEETWRFLQNIERDIDWAISELEDITGEPNSMLRLLIKLLGNVPLPHEYD